MHAGSLVALRPDGSVALALGDVASPVLPRSANKPLQAVALLRAGWQPRDEAQVALAAASHSGEPRHAEVVYGMLAPGSEQQLRCPPSLPLDEATAHALVLAGGGPARVHMNCSGKHAAMVATSRQCGWDPAGYLDPDGPLQKAVTEGVERLAGERVTAVVVDGCGAPQHALTLPGLARAYARLVVAEQGTPERRVADAVRAHPALVGGRGRDVTLLMQALPGLLAKDGAEGVYAAALPDGGAGAVKVADGAARPRVPVLVAALRLLGARGDGLDLLSTVPVLGGGREVGQVRPAGRLAA